MLPNELGLAALPLNQHLIITGMKISLGSLHLHLPLLIGIDYQNVGGRRSEPVARPAPSPPALQSRDARADLND
jgi:hypothetical protein